MDENEVEIMLDKPRHLRLDLNAMVDYEKATNKSVWALDENMTATDLRALLWACLRHEDETLLQHNVGRMITPGNFVELTKKLQELYALVMPTEKKKRGKTSPLAKDRT